MEYRHARHLCHGAHGLPDNGAGQQLLTVRENAVVEAALAREQKQDYFLFEALKTLQRAEEQLRALDIEPPALASKELDMAFVMMILAADE